MHREKGAPVSGARLGAQLGVSRNYIWKLVEQLREEGVEIRSIPHRGYCLPVHRPNLFPFEIEEAARGTYFISVLPSVGSTNQVVKEMAEQGAPERTVVFTEEQTAGRGRQSRRFFSPKGSGLYFSVLLRPEKGMADALRITAAAGVAVARGVADVLGLDLQIKWVNDLFYQNKKVCGILSEGAVDLEGGGLAYCVLGIGLNVFEPSGGFQDLRQIAGALLSGTPDGSLLARLAAAVLDHFFALYQHLEQPALMQEYRQRSFLQGKTITVRRGAEEFRCVVLGISDEGALQTRLETGEERAFSSGEIKVEDFR